MAIKFNKKLRPERYIKRAKLKEIILKSKTSVEKRMTAFHKQEIKDITDNMDIEREIEVEELKAEIDKLTQHIRINKEKERQVNQMYLENKRKAKETNNISSDNDFQYEEAVARAVAMVGILKGRNTIATDNYTDLITNSHKYNTIG
jgi:hypothetical protein